ncbi:MAG: hypothetical protein ABIX28_05970 [Vicinamibacterales bacterium]
MTALLLALLAAGPCVYWTQGVDSKPALDAVGVAQICVAPEQVAAWTATGINATPVEAADLTARQALPVPGTAPRAGLASPTRAPWIVSNGWRMLRRPGGKYSYTVPAGRGALAAAEAAAYGLDALLQIDPVDLAAVAPILAFAAGLPSDDLPPVADLAVVDDGTEATGEVMNLLARRNLLFAPVSAGSSAYPLTIAVGSAASPLTEAADPSAFAQKVRSQLTDARRSLRIFGSEVVIGRLTGNGTRARLHLVNYGGRDIEGLRVRVRGTFRTIDASMPGAGTIAVTDVAIADGGTEFSLPRISVYAVVEMR